MHKIKIKRGNLGSLVTLDNGEMFLSNDQHKLFIQDSGNIQEIQLKREKGISGGYQGLDSNQKIPKIQIPFTERTYCECINNSVYTINKNTYYLQSFENVISNINNMWDLQTSTFTQMKQGYYQFNINVDFGYKNKGTREVHIFKNGTNMNKSQIILGSDKGSLVNNNQILYLDQNDTIQIGVRITEEKNQDIQSDTTNMTILELPQNYV